MWGRAGHLLRALSHTRKKRERREQLLLAGGCCLENGARQPAASARAKGDTGEQEETKHQTLSRWLCCIDASPASGALPGSGVSTQGQHCSIPATLKLGETITICYCTQRAAPQAGQGRSLSAFLLAWFNSSR